MAESEFVDILENGQILKKPLRTGDSSLPRPQRGDIVTINLITKLKESQTRVESECFENLEISVGQYDLIHGLDLVIPLMSINELSQVIIAPRFGYGDKGKEPDILPNTSFDCEIEVLTCKSLSEVNLKHRFEIVLRKKARSNFFYSRQDYSIAIQCYKNAIEILEELEIDEESTDPDDKNNEEKKTEEIDENLFKKMSEVRIQLYNNLAIAQMKIENYNAALESLEKVFQVSENNVKALYRKGKILALKGELNEAINNYKAVLKLEPGMKFVERELLELTSQKQKQLSEEKQMYKRMLKLEKENNSKTNEKKSSLNFSWPAVLAASMMVVLGIVVYKIN